MARFSLQTDYERAEESRKICIYNLENQKKKFDEIKMQIVTVEKLLNNRPLSQDVYKSQIILHNRLKRQAMRLSGLISELEGELKAAEENLIRIKKNYTP